MAKSGENSFPEVEGDPFPDALAAKGHSRGQHPESGEINLPPSWRYKSLKVGPITLPWYASPKSQLILVSFVCFLCPGKSVCKTEALKLRN